MHSRTLSLATIVTMVSAAALAAGCSGASDGADELDDAPGAQPLASDAALPGTKIHAGGSFSCDFGLPAGLPLDQVAPAIERDRMYMAERPGMQTKQLPLAFDFATGQLLSGGRYLFDEAAQAEDYEDWVRHDFVLDGVLFLERPIFIAPDCHAWKVIGARAFAPIESQLVMRTERWSVSQPDLTGVLHARWASLVEAAADRGLGAVWLLKESDDSVVQLVYFADRVAPPDPTTPDFASLFALQGAPALGDEVADAGWTKTFDRTQWVLTVWFPFEAGDQGAASLWPHSPPFPAPFCGDGVCEPSRGEDGAACSADCAPQCGDAACQADEATLDCPSDCRL